MQGRPALPTVPDAIGEYPENRAEANNFVANEGSTNCHIFIRVRKICLRTHKVRGWFSNCR